MIGAISGANSYYSMYLPQSTQRTANLWPARTSGTGTAVEPVTPVRPADEVGTEKERVFRQELPAVREGADPVEMAVRMRIQYPEAEAASAGTPSGAAAPQDEPMADAALGAGDVQKAAEEGRCETCEERKYQDGSDDPGVSFKTPTNVSPEQAASAVRGHEMEHVVREQAAARREDRKVVSQSVTYHTDICPECGRVYVSGGTTRTVTAANDDPTPQQNPEEQNPGRVPFSAVA